MATKPQKPVKTFYLGSVGCSIFSKERKSKTGDTFTSFSVSVTRSYFDDKGERKYTEYLDPTDLGSAAILIQMAASTIVELKNKQ